MMKAEDLKNSILQMAMQGKLVPQNPEDEPASVLLEKIKQEKLRLIKNKKIRKERNVLNIIKKDEHYYRVNNKKESENIDNWLFDIPSTWHWKRLGDIFYCQSGLSYKKNQLNDKTDDMVRILRGGNIDLMGHYLLKKDDYYISSKHVKNELHLKKNTLITPAVTSLEHVGKIARINKDLNNTVVGGFVLMLKQYIDDDISSKYFSLILSSQFHRKNCKNITRKSGQAFYNISREKLLNLPIPIPPLNEQKRIVEKLEQILPQIEQYGKYEEQLTKLNQEFPEKLKKSILQQAIQGKLVPQNPEDEPASVLLENIKQEKEQLIKDGKIKRNKNESTIYKKDGHWYEVIDRNNEVKCIDEEIPFDIPKNWIWGRVNNLSLKIHYGYTASAKKEGYCKLLRITDIQNNIVNWSNVPFCEINEDKIENYVLKDKDILIARTGGTIGKSFLIKNLKDVSVFASYLIRLIPSKFINEEYLKVFLESPLFWIELSDRTMGTGQPNVNATSLKNLIIPIPPVNEQKRLVDKIYELFAVVDERN